MQILQTYRDNVVAVNIITTEKAQQNQGIIARTYLSAKNLFGFGSSKNTPKVTKVPKGKIPPSHKSSKNPFSFFKEILNSIRNFLSRLKTNKKNQKSSSVQSSKKETISLNQLPIPPVTPVKKPENTPGFSDMMYGTPLFKNLFPHLTPRPIKFPEFYGSTPAPSNTPFFTLPSTPSTLTSYLDDTHHSPGGTSPFVNFPMKDFMKAHSILSGKPLHEIMSKPRDLLIELEIEKKQKGLDELRECLDKYQKWDLIKNFEEEIQEQADEFSKKPKINEFIKFYNEVATFDKSTKIHFVESVQELHKKFIGKGELFKDVPEILEDEILKTYSDLYNSVKEKEGLNLKKISLKPRIKFSRKTQNQKRYDFKSDISNIQEALKPHLNNCTPFDRTTNFRLNKCVSLLKLLDHYNEFFDKNEQLETLNASERDLKMILMKRDDLKVIPTIQPLNNASKWWVY
jgi:hypothetical protein